MQADGYSLDDKRTPQPDKSDLPDILARWQNRRTAEAERKRTDRSFLVPKDEIADNDYDLSINRYKEVEYEAVEYDPPKVILERLAKLEEEIARGGRSWRGCWDEWPMSRLGHRREVLNRTRQFKTHDEIRRRRHAVSADEERRRDGRFER